MEFLSVRNWRKYQHYGKRCPPWIKFYGNLLDDYGMAQLPDASKGHAMSLMLLASRCDNKIPIDPVWIKEKISAHDDVDIEALKESGLFETSSEEGKQGKNGAETVMLAPMLAPDASNMMLASVEESREEERRGDARGDDAQAPATTESDATAVPFSSSKKSPTVKMTENWTPGESTLKWLKDELAGHSSLQEQIISEFRNFWMASGKRRAMKNWDIAFMKNPLVKQAIAKTKMPAKNGTASPEYRKMVGR